MTNNRVSKLIMPGLPSERFFIDQRQINDTTFQDDPPFMDRTGMTQIGVDVTDWQEVLVFNWADDDDAGYTGCQVTITPWWYFKPPSSFVDVTGSVGNYPTQGLWVCGADKDLAIDAAGLTIDQHAIYHTLNADRMFFQIKVYTQGGGENLQDLEWMRQGIVGVTPRRADGEAVGTAGSAGGSSGGGGDGDVNIVQVAGNAVSAGAGAVAAGTMRITWCSDSPGIGAHDSPTANPGFRSLYVATTADPAAVADQDDVHPIADVYGRQIIAGYNRTGDHLETALVAESLGLGEHDVATQADGMRALAVATTADPAAVADQDDVHLITTTTGKLIVAGYNRTGDHLDMALVAESLGLGVHDTATETDGMRGLAVATNVDPADVANQDDVHMVATLDGKLIIAGYDRLGDLVRIQETDPINYHIAWDVIEESSMGTAGSPYVYYLDLDTYYRMSLQIDVTLGSADAGGVALTTLGTVEDDDPDLTARNYVDMTNAWTGSASITVDAILTDTNGFWGNFTAVKLNVAVTNGDDDSAIKIDTKRHVGG